MYEKVYETLDRYSDKDLNYIQLFSHAGHYVINRPPCKWSNYTWDACTFVSPTPTLPSPSHTCTDTHFHSIRFWQR